MVLIVNQKWRMGNEAIHTSNGWKIAPTKKECGDTLFILEGEEAEDVDRYAWSGVITIQGQSFRVITQGEYLWTDELTGTMEVMPVVDDRKGE